MVNNQNEKNGKTRHLVLEISLEIRNWILEILRNFFISLISIYQKTLSPDHSLLRHLFPFGVCRYTPTCSDYAKVAITRFGVLRGVPMSVKRVIRCNPFVAGGDDPVPDLTNKSNL